MEPIERAALLGSYRRARGLSGEVPEPQLKALMYLAALDNLAFLAERPHERGFVLEALPEVSRAIAKLTTGFNRLNRPEFSGGKKA
jgi:hypothetical protein